MPLNSISVKLLAIKQLDDKVKTLPCIFIYYDTKNCMYHCVLCAIKLEWGGQLVVIILCHSSAPDG